MISADGGTWKKTEVDTTSLWEIGQNKTSKQIISELQELGDRETGLEDTLELLKSPFHEARLLALAELLLHDREDLIQKAAGWMLRYAIEKFPEGQKAFLQGSR
ncbi:MAG: DNA alkylation repair protein [Thermoleophilia bacterium]